MPDCIEPISLYIHVPFCVAKCRYCDFYSIPFDESIASDYIHALAKEWALVKKEYHLGNTEIQTVFFGGGTPSILAIDQWELIDRLLMKSLRLSPDVEWTIECNPDSFTQEKAALWISMGVTRLTFGVQSLDDRELTVLGRPHSAAQAVSSLQSPVLSRFKSIGVDLMYGLPGQTLSSFEKTLALLLKEQNGNNNPAINHLSAYELTVNPQTCFGRHRAILPFPSDEEAMEMARLLFDRCRSASFERYEISNFAKPGFRCRHNEAYWNHSPYIGLGPAAHSFVARQRLANVKSVSKYISDLNEGERPLEFKEVIDNEKLISEMIFLRLRTADGLDENDFETRTGRKFYSDERVAKLDDMLKNKLVRRLPPMWSLTGEGMLLADAIAKRLV
jgi:oxygen-independent coproporphyrinogen-3 oxidase